MITGWTNRLVSSADAASLKIALRKLLATVASKLLGQHCARATRTLLAVKRSGRQSGRWMEAGVTLPVACVMACPFTVKLHQCRRPVPWLSYQWWLQDEPNFQVWWFCPRDIFSPGSPLLSVDIGVINDDDDDDFVLLCSLSPFVNAISSTSPAFRVLYKNTIYRRTCKFTVIQSIILFEWDH